MHNYTDNPANFPATISLIDDSDAPNAANFGTANEGLADRTATLGTNLLASGRYPAYTGVAVPNDLTAITGMANKDTRLVLGYGSYHYNSTAAGLSDGLFQVDGNGGVGRWQITDNATSARLVKEETRFYQGAQVVLTAHGGTCNDPGNRNASHLTDIGFAILTSSTFTPRVGDTFVVSYSLPFFLVRPSLGGDTSGDPVVGVGYNSTGAGTLVYPDALLDNACQVSVDVDAGGRNLGQMPVITASTTQRTSFARTASFTPSLTTAQKFSLVIGEFALIGGVVTQGAMLHIAQYRNVIV